MKSFFAFALAFTLGCLASPLLPRLAGPAHAGGSPKFDNQSDWDLPEKDETRQSFEMQFGGSLNVSRINGSVTVESANTPLAEVVIVRSAKTREALSSQKIEVERTSNRLTIQGEKSRHDDDRNEVRHRVFVRVPNNTQVSVEGVNGWVKIGRMDNVVKVSGINGKVDVTKVMFSAEIEGVNGHVSVGIAQLGDRGLAIEGVNGKVEVRLGENVNADIQAVGVNGNVTADGLSLTVEGKMNPRNYKARLGTGGPPMSFTGINGNVRITSALPDAK